MIRLRKERVGWYHDNSGENILDVGLEGRNHLGLHDMSGNVWEWCWNWLDEFPNGHKTDYRGPIKKI